MDAQLEIISLENGGSLLQLFMVENSHLLQQVVAPNTTHFSENTHPNLYYQNPHIKNLAESLSVKRRKMDDCTATFVPEGHMPNPLAPTHTRRKWAMLDIDMIGQMRMGFTMHKAQVMEREKHMLKKKRLTKNLPTLRHHQVRLANSEYYIEHSRESSNYSTPPNNQMSHPCMRIYPNIQASPKVSMYNLFQ